MSTKHGSARILMLHRVLDDEPAAFNLPSGYRLRGTALTVSELLRAVDEAPPIAPLDAVEEALAHGGHPSAGSVLTFDDGYREHLDVAAPPLAARGVQATFYVAPLHHGDGSRVALVDAWYWLLDHAIERIARVPLPGGGVYRGRIDTHEGKCAWVRGEPKAALFGAKALEQTTMLKALATSTGSTLPDDLAARLYLRPAEWSALVALEMRVGAHSLSHPRLIQLDDDALRAEIQGSVDALKQLCNAVAFAYPDGAFDERVIREVRRAEVSSVTREPGALSLGCDPMLLPREFVVPSAFQFSIEVSR